MRQLIVHRSFGEIRRWREPAHPLRSAAFGTYPAGQLWEQIIRKDAPKDTQAADLADDDQIIAVVGSRTGEVRQCGNLSGYCVSSNPWKAVAAPAPAALTKHAEPLTEGREEVIRRTESRKD